MKKRQQHKQQHETRTSRTKQRIEIRKGADGSTISGTAVVWNSLSEFMGFFEQIAPEAFTQSLKDFPNVRVLNQHAMEQPLGDVASGTAKVWQDKNGLQFTCKLPATSWAADLAALIADGIVHDMSFGFNVEPGGEEWSTQADGTPLRTITAARLFEISVVTAGAYSEPSVSLRNAPAHIREQIRGITVSDDESERGFFTSIDTDDDSDNDSDSDGDAGDSDGTEEDDPLDFCQCRCGECRAENCDGCSLCEDDEMCNECAAFQERQRKQRESERSMYLDLIMRRL